MISPPYFVALLLAAHLVASAATNYSVDDQNLLFKYSKGWVRITGDMDKDGGHMLAQSPELSATITYTCVYLLKTGQHF